MKHFSILALVLIFFGIKPCYAQHNRANASDEYIATLKKITDIMVSDVTSPVGAARYYGYITLAAYEVLSFSDPIAYPSLKDILKIPPISLSDKNLVHNIDLNLALNLTLLKAAEKSLPSGPTLNDEIKMLIEAYSKGGHDKNKLQSSLALATEVADHIVRWSKTDGFVALNNLKKYTPKNDPAYWQPTAPAFMAPVEPNWSTIRPFLLDSAQQFKPKEPAPFSKDKGSSYFIQLQEVYDTGNRANKKEQQIAMFWDCNPFALQQIGHVEFGMKKISPGGHWIGITGIACKKKKMPLKQTVLIHSLIGITMHDAFIACWDEKYRSDRVRPETAINQWIDPRWRPLLQTPPFPEYVSGHSVVSSAMAVILTEIFGDNLSFTDDTETEFGLGKRKFKSFIQAADEASISRLYGGIHYRDAIDQGIWQGKQVGYLSLKKLSPFYSISKKRF